MVDTDAAVAFGSGMFAEVFVAEDDFPGVLWVPDAIDGPAAFDKRLKSSVTKPEIE